MMEYHLDRRLVLLTEPKHKRLYSWAINEIDDRGQVLGHDQIPWAWTLHFTAIQITLSDRITVREARSQEEGLFSQEAEISETRAIHAVLRPGDGRPHANRFWSTRYRMFGTDRLLDRFHLDIRPLPAEEDMEGCRAWGMVSYTHDTDFRSQTEPDYVSFELMVKPSTFEMYARRIAEGTVDEVVLAVKRVSGFYSEWSPDIDTRDVKVLATTKDQVVELPEGIQFEAPRLGPVGEAELFINARRSSSKTATQEDDGEEPASAPLVRMEAAASAAGIDPQVVKLLQSLNRSARLIFALLVMLLVAILLGLAGRI